MKVHGRIKYFKEILFLFQVFVSVIHRSSLKNILLKIIDHADDCSEITTLTICCYKNILLIFMLTHRWVFCEQSELIFCYLEC